MTRMNENINFFFATASGNKYYESAGQHLAAPAVQFPLFIHTQIRESMWVCQWPFLPLVLLYTHTQSFCGDAVTLHDSRFKSWEPELANYGTSGDCRFKVIMLVLRGTWMHRADAVFCKRNLRRRTRLLRDKMPSDHLPLSNQFKMLQLVLLFKQVSHNAASAAPSSLWWFPRTLLDKHKKTFLSL